MVCHSIFALAAFAACILKAQASPCRPTATTATTATSGAAAISSTAVSESTLASLGTTLTAATTTSVLVSETISTTVAEATTTSAAASACIETQVVINPGFDSSANSIEPWLVGSGHITSDAAYSGPNSLALVFESGQGTALLSQTLHNLNGKYILSYHYAAMSAQNLGGGFSCLITPKIGDHELPPVDVYEISSWQSASQEWSTGNVNVAEIELSLSAVCSGEYDLLIINIDEVTLTEVCDGSATQD